MAGTSDGYPRPLKEKIELFDPKLPKNTFFRYNKPQMNIVLLGNPILRKKAKPISNIKDKKVQKVIKDLEKTVIKVNGVGLSAPQLDESFRIFIMASHPNPRYPKAPLMKPTIIINPLIISVSKKQIKDWEGCLSVPGIRGIVSRYETIKTSYINSTGNPVKKEFKGFLSRIFQHEYDHLEGIVFLDRVENNKDLISEFEYQKLILKDK